MKNKILTYITSILLISNCVLKAQDAQFSQYYAAPLNLSPSFAGAADGLRVIGNYRLQWPVINNPLVAYNTSSLAFDYYFPGFNSGVGIIATATSAGNGLLIKSKFAGVYSYNLHVFKGWFVRPGIEFSYNRIDYDLEKFTFGDQLKKENAAQNGGIYTTDENFSDFETGVGNIDIGASVLVYSSLYWGGFTMAHLIKPNESVMFNSNESTVIPIKSLVYGGAKIDINGRLGRENEESLFASFLYRNQGKFDQFDLGAYWLRMPILLGIWYRGLPGIKMNDDNSVSHDALTFIAGYKRNKLSVSFSYDVTISNLFLDSGGAYELALSYIIADSKDLKRRPKRILVPCPRF